MIKSKKKKKDVTSIMAQGVISGGLFKSFPQPFLKLRSVNNSCFLTGEADKVESLNYLGCPFAVVDPTNLLRFPLHHVVLHC